jgi:hypothetical protein
MGDGSTTGGSVLLKAGVASPGSTCQANDGTVWLQNAGATASLAIAGSGSVVVSGADVSVTSNNDLHLETKAEQDEVKFTQYDNGVAMRVKAGTGDLADPATYESPAVISHVPIQSVAYDSPSDRRIKTQISDVDEEEILQRLQGLEIKSYHYTDAWRKVRNIDDHSVRGVIAQQAREVFPEYVHIQKNYEVPEKDFTLSGFHQVNKEAIVLDLVAALHAHHRRFGVTENTEQRGGDVSITSGTSGGDSGGTTMHSGDVGSGDSGAVSISSGLAPTTTGSVRISGGGGGAGAAPFLLQGGRVQISSGESSDRVSGSISLETRRGVKSGSFGAATGASSASGSGFCAIQSGETSDGDAGTVQMVAGGGNFGGDVSLSGGCHSAQSGGQVLMCAGDATNSAGVGGPIVLKVSPNELNRRSPNALLYREVMLPQVAEYRLQVANPRSLLVDLSK